MMMGKISQQILLHRRRSPGSRPSGTSGSGGTLGELGLYGTSGSGGTVGEMGVSMVPVRLVVL